MAKVSVKDLERMDGFFKKIGVYGEWTKPDLKDINNSFVFYINNQRLIIQISNDKFCLIANNLYINIDIIDFRYSKTQKWLVFYYCGHIACSIDLVNDIKYPKLPKDQLEKVIQFIFDAVSGYVESDFDKIDIYCNHEIYEQIKQFEEIPILKFITIDSSDTIFILPYDKNELQQDKIRNIRF